jgi:hypothetical protein
MKRKPGVFTEAINVIDATVVYQAAPDEVVDSCKRAIRALKILEGAAIIQNDKRFYLDVTTNDKLVELLVKSRRDAEKQPKQVNK